MTHAPYCTGITQHHLLIIAYTLASWFKEISIGLHEGLSLIIDCDIYWTFAILHVIDAFARG